MYVHIRINIIYPAIFIFVHSIYFLRSGCPPATDTTGDVAYTDIPSDPSERRVVLKFIRS